MAERNWDRLNELHAKTWPYNARSSRSGDVIRVKVLGQQPKSRGFLAGGVTRRTDGDCRSLHHGKMKTRSNPIAVFKMLIIKLNFGIHI